MGRKYFKLLYHSVLMLSHDVSRKRLVKCHTKANKFISQYEIYILLPRVISVNVFLHIIALYSHSRKVLFHPIGLMQIDLELKEMLPYRSV